MSLIYHITRTSTMSLKVSRNPLMDMYGDGRIKYNTIIDPNTMKRSLLILALFISSVIMTWAQTITTVSIDHEFYLRTPQFMVEPDYHPEPGVIIVDVDIDHYGIVSNPSIRAEGTTVKNERQLESTMKAANRCGFRRDDDAPDSLRRGIKYTFIQLTQIQVDSLQLVKTDKLYDEVKKVERTIDSQRFKLYPTDNMWTFIELDTVYGWVYQVQYSTKGDDYRFKTTISYKDLREGSLYSENEIIPGRFELYKTQNMYNFILLDQLDGRTWQVQWSMEPENRGIMRIY